MSKLKRLTEKDFQDIKLLIKAGLKTSDVVRLSGRSINVVHVMRKAETLEQYKEIMRARVKKWQKPKEEPNEVPSVPEVPESVAPETSVQVAEQIVEGFQDAEEQPQEVEAPNKEKYITFFFKGGIQRTYKNVDKVYFSHGWTTVVTKDGIRFSAYGVSYETNCQWPEDFRSGEEKKGLFGF